MKQIRSLLEEKWHYVLLGMSGFILILISSLVFIMIQNKISNETLEEDMYVELMSEDTLALVEAAPENSETNEEMESKEEMISPGEVTVDVKGAVLHPGVYTLGESKRIIDAIEQAGGLEADAEGKEVNFSQILEDQMVIYVPRIGEEIDNHSIVQTPDIKRDEAADPSGEKININIADQTQLMSLNGIGQVKAENIINYREEHGLFQTIDDLKKVSGIGEATFNNLLDHITVSK